MIGQRPVTGGNPRTNTREDLDAERARLKTMPPSPERTAALTKITMRIKSLKNRSDRNGL